jgi:hypothetical protein
MMFLVIESWRFMEARPKTNNNTQTDESHRINRRGQ